VTAQQTDDAYPSSWKPAHLKRHKDAETEFRLGVEMYLAEMSDADFADLTARCRPRGGR
jgi:hypothetical protein